MTCIRQVMYKIECPKVTAAFATVVSAETTALMLSFCPLPVLAIGSWWSMVCRSEIPLSDHLGEKIRQEHQSKMEVGEQIARPRSSQGRRPVAVHTRSSHVHGITRT